MNPEVTGTAPEKLVAVPVRHYGRWLSALVVLGLFAWLVSAFTNADIFP